MKKRNNRFLAGTLAGLMMLTMLPVTALAAEESAGSEITTLTTEDGGVVSGIPNNIVNVVSDGDSEQPAVDNDGKVEENTGNENVQTPDEDSEAEADAVAPQEGEDSGSGSGSEPVAAPEVESFAAKIGDTEYESLDAAIKAAESGAEIEIGNDEGVITVNEIRKNLVINGNGHTVTIPDQKETEHNSLDIYASLTFNNTKVKFANNLDDRDEPRVWSATVNNKGVLTLDKGSICTIENHGIYACDSKINITGGSKLIIQDTTYTAMMAEASSTLNIEEDSTLLINHAYNDDGVPNGITGFRINVLRWKSKFQFGKVNPCSACCLQG